MDGIITLIRTDAKKLSTSSTMKANSKVSLTRQKQALDIHRACQCFGLGLLRLRSYKKQMCISSPVSDFLF